MPGLKKIPHVAFVTAEALYWPETSTKLPFVRTFVTIPRGYAHSRFTVEWLESNGVAVACIRFKVWKRRRRRA
jgi:hypothetical protein